MIRVTYDVTVVGQYCPIRVWKDGNHINIQLDPECKFSTLTKEEAKDLIEALKLAS